MSKKDRKPKAARAGKPAGDDRNGLALRTLGLDLRVPAKPDRAPVPETWRDVAGDVDRSLMGSVVYLFRLPKAVLAGLVSLFRGVGDLPDDAAPPVELPANPADAARLAEVVNLLRSRGVHARVEQVDGRTWVFVTAEASKKLPDELATQFEPKA